MAIQKDENRKAIDELAASVKASNASLEALSGALMQFVVLGEEGRRELEEALNRYRRLGKYIRRTHFWTMAAMVFGALLLADFAHHTHSSWWGLLFWATQHGDGGTTEWILRGLGFLWQAGYLTYLIKIAQVPEDLESEIASAQVRRERDQGRERRGKS